MLIEARAGRGHHAVRYPTAARARPDDREEVSASWAIHWLPDRWMIRHWPPRRRRRRTGASRGVRPMVAARVPARTRVAGRSHGCRGRDAAGVHVGLAPTRSGFDDSRSALSRGSSGSPVTASPTRTRRDRARDDSRRRSWPRHTLDPPPSATTSPNTDGRRGAGSAGAGAASGCSSPSTSSSATRRSPTLWGCPWAP